MSSNRKFCSKFIVGVRKIKDLDAIKSFYAEFPVAGLVLFNAPHDSADYIWTQPEEAEELLYALMSFTTANKSFLSVDQEGGRVQRLRGPFPKIPTALQIGRHYENTDRHDQFFRFFQLQAQQLRQAGIRLNLAPVVDLYHPEGNPAVGDRCFSEQSLTVMNVAKLYCEAFESENVATTLKHFPGLGSSHADSHEKLALLQKTQTEIEALELPLFEELAEFASGIMPGHMAFSDHPDICLSLDFKFIERWKKQFPTHNFWITDDLITMKAVDPDYAVFECYKSHYDYLLLCGDLDENARAIDRCLTQATDDSESLRFNSEFDLQLRHSRERFLPLSAPPPFNTWRRALRDLGQQLTDFMNEWNLPEPDPKAD